MIPISKPFVGNLEKKFLFKEVKDGWISSRGKRINQFENQLSKFLKVKYRKTTAKVDDEFIFQRVKYINGFLIDQRH